MFRMRRELECRNDGFTVVEVVIAAAVLFFVLTAVLGLVASSTNMSLSAKQRSVMVNEVSSWMEYVRSLDFDELVNVPTNHVVPIEGTPYTVTINTEVTDGRSGTREVNVTAFVTGAGRHTLSMESFAAVWDKENGFTEAYDPDAPIVTFGLQTPVSEAVIYGTLVYSPAGSLVIDAEAHSPVVDGKITELRFYCSGYALRDGPSSLSNVAVWTTNENSISKFFNWDTQQIGDEYTPHAIEDGWRTVSVVATDDEGRESRVDRRFYVDNYAPESPGVPAAQVFNNVDVRLAWNKAMDGTHPALGYEIRLNQIVSADGTLVELANNEPAPQPVFQHVGSTFSRYVLSARATSPRNHSDYVEMTSPYVTRPLAQGNSATAYVGSGNSTFSETSVTVTCFEPNFPVSYVRYDVFRSEDPNVWNYSKPLAEDVDPTFTDFISKRVRTSGVPDPYYYQFRVSYVAQGYGGGSTSEPPVFSNVIGPTSTPDRPDPLNSPPEVVVMEHVQW